MSKFKKRQRTAKGRRPFFLNNPESDKLLAIITALVGEVAVIRDRLDTHERLASKGIVATPENIEAYNIDEEAEDQRELYRIEMLDRVFRIISPDFDKSVYDKKDSEYQELVDRFSHDK